MTEHKHKWDRLALSYMDDCESILDVGCGDGRFINLDSDRIGGCDGNKPSVDLCKSRGFKVRRCNLPSLPYPSNSFDAVHCCHVIEHFTPRSAYKLLKECDRVLRDGGILVIRTPLLYEQFYNDLSHQRPYNPRTIQHYLVDYGRSRTFPKLSQSYRVLLLKYRRAPLFPYSQDTILRTLSGALHMIGVSSLKKNGYMMILQKGDNR